MPIFFLSIIVQVALVVHIVKHGKNTTWIWIVVMLPMAGSIAYIIVEVLPGLSNTRGARKAKSSLLKSINPHKEFKQALLDYELSDTADNALRLAQAYRDNNNFQQAKDIYQKSLTGLLQYDPELMRGLALCEFELGNFKQCKNILDKLIEENPDFKNPDTHLLYARCLEKLDETSAALHEYQTLDQYYSGPEASYRYAMLLKQMGEVDKAKSIIQQILKDASYEGKHYHSLYAEWIKKAKAEAK